MRDEDVAVSAHAVAPRPRLRVAHVIHSLGAGGAEGLLVDLATVSCSYGIDLTVIGLSDAEDSRIVPLLEEAGALVHGLHAARYDGSAVLRVARILRDERIDLVHTHLKHADLVGGLAARIVGVPAVSTLHLIEDTEASSVVNAKNMVAVAGRWCLSRRVIALSKAQRRWYAGFRLADQGSVVLIPNGIRQPRPQRGRDEVRAELGIPDGAVLALTVSLLRPEKGHATLLDAIRLLGLHGDVVACLAGDGPLLEDIRAEVAADPVLSSHVRILGFRRDVDDLISAADVVVHPSYRDALPTALISALAAGAPIIASDVGGIPDIVAPDSGRLVPPGDAPALARALTEFATDVAGRAACGQAGMARFSEQFAADVWASRLRALYVDVLREDAAGRVPRADRAHVAGRERAVRSVALLSAVDPFPADNGKNVVIGGFLRHLLLRVPEQVHFLHVGNPLDNHNADWSGVRVHEMGTPTTGDHIRGLLIDAVLRRRSLQETFTASRTVRRHVGSALAEVDPDLIIVDTLRMAQYVEGLRLRGRLVVYLDDLFSLRYERMLDILQESRGIAFDPLGNFQRFVPRRLHVLTRLPQTRNALLQFEARRVRRSEERVTRLADSVLLLNAGEADLLSERTGLPVVAIPPSMPARSSWAGTWHGQADFCFVGLLNIAHNLDGLSWFLAEGMGELLTLRPDARLHVIGRGAPDTLVAMCRKYGDRVILHGYVENLDELLSSCAALVNPLRFGSGIKIKTLEALSRGLPVVCTPVAADGISEESRPGQVVHANAADLARSMVDLLDPAVRAAASHDALRLFAEEYGPQEVLRAYDDVFGLSDGLSPLDEL